MSAFPILDPILFPLYYCKLVMTGSNSELIRARIFWCRYLCCRCCCKRFNIDSVADEVFMEYRTGFGGCPFTLFMNSSSNNTTLTSAAAIHAFVLGYPSDIWYCGHCCDSTGLEERFPHTSGPQPSANYLNLYMLLMCGADPNLRLGSDIRQRDVTNQTPLHLVASRLQRGRKKLVNAASSQPWWDWRTFAKYWCDQSSKVHAGFNYRDADYDYEYLHNHPIEVCGYASYYLGKMSLGYCCCYPPCCSGAGAGAGAGADMPYDLVTTTNLHAAELLIRYGADASLLDSNGRTPLETIDDADIRGRLQRAVDAVAAGRASREKEVTVETAQWRRRSMRSKCTEYDE